MNGRIAIEEVLGNDLYGGLHIHLAQHCIKIHLNGSSKIGKDWCRGSRGHVTHCGTCSRGARHGHREYLGGAVTGVAKSASVGKNSALTVSNT